MDSDKNTVGQENDVQPTVQVAATAASEIKAPPDLAETAQAKPEAAPKKSSKPTLKDLKPGMTFKGRVRNVVDFGAFVDIGVGRDGLAHISVLKRAGIDKTLRVGDTLEVAIRRVDVEKNRISLTVPGGEGDSKATLSSLKRNAVVTGRVVRLVDFGAFIDVGAQTDGLVHVSELPWGYVNSPSDVLNVGDEVQVRILEVDSRKRRISLSMKGTTKETIEANTANDEPDANYPTAFEIAFEEARQDLKRRQRRTHR